MRFRAQIRIEFESEDFVTAAEHQRRIEEVFAQLKASYPTAGLEINQVRFRQGNGASFRRTPGRRSAQGNLAHYED